MNNEFQNKSIIVTGASSGIGKATALMAYERGAHVTVVARRKTELTEPLNDERHCHWIGKP